jgi:hypothetical protein
LLLKDGLRFVQHRIANMMPNFLCENNLGFTDEFKPDMQTPSEFPKRTLFLAKRARSTVETRGGGAFYLDGASEPYN